MAMGENEPLGRQPGCTEPGQAHELPCSSPEPGDDYFSSGSFSPVTMQFGDEPEAPESEPEESPRRAPDPSSDRRARKLCASMTSMNVGPIAMMRPTPGIVSPRSQLPWVSLASTRTVALFSMPMLVAINSAG